MFGFLHHKQNQEQHTASRKKSEFNIFLAGYAHSKAIQLITSLYRDNQASHAFGIDYWKYDIGHVQFKFWMAQRINSISIIKSNYVQNVDAVLICPDNLSTFYEISKDLMPFHTKNCYWVMTDDLDIKKEAEGRGLNVIPVPTPKIQHEFLYVLNNLDVANQNDPVSSMRFYLFYKKSLQPEAQELAHHYLYRTQQLFLHLTDNDKKENALKQIKALLVNESEGDMDFAIMNEACHFKGYSNGL